MTAGDEKVIATREVPASDGASRCEDLREAIDRFFLLSGSREEIRECLWFMLTDSLTGDVMKGEAARRCHLYRELTDIIGVLGRHKSLRS